MFWLLAMLANPAHAADLEVTVNSGVLAVLLDCEGEKLEASTSSGTQTPDGRVSVTFPVRPGRQCDVLLIESAGQLEQLGSWDCAPGACTQVAGGAEPINVPDGQVHLTLDADFPHNQIELSCPSGYRQRAMLTDHVGVFDGVPQGDECIANFKGGAPMKYAGLSWGAWSCVVVSNTPVCTKQ